MCLAMILSFIAGISCLVAAIKSPPLYESPNGLIWMGFSILFGIWFVVSFLYMLHRPRIIYTKDGKTIEVK